jgi:Fe2+ or Zn2+ uptake regulation protein
MSCYGVLEQKGLRLSLPRRLVLDYIHARSQHLTGEEIITQVHEKYPQISITTISRTLGFLENEGCVYRRESNSRDVYHLSDDGPHHHLVCNECGKTIACDDKMFTSVQRSVEIKYGFHINSDQFVFKGTCAMCASFQD